MPALVGVLAAVVVALVEAPLMIVRRSSYYNEIDPYAAQWLRNLIAAGHIAAGDVDERSIQQVDPWDLHGYTQCHFFAGIGVWSHALRLAGWPDERPVWTGSCPCQPFSAAGKGEGTADARHLWPEWFRLIRECRPVAVFGEQVGAAIRHGWLDLVSTDLEGADYTFGAAVVGAHSAGAPHIRQRVYFAADSERQQEHKEQQRPEAYERERSADSIGGRGMAGELADRDGGNASAERQQRGGEHGQQPQDGGAAGDVGDTYYSRSQGRRLHFPASGGIGEGERLARKAGSTFWSNVDWLPCIDGKARPVEPGTFPLAHGAPARVGRLRAYGNAIVAPLAVEFVAAYLECRP